MINIVIGNVEIPDGEIKKIAQKVASNITYKIIFEGRYPVMREFGVPAMEIDMQFISELTKSFMDSGLEHKDAVKQAYILANNIKKEGLLPQPFLRPAINKFTDTTALQIDDIGDINSFAAGITKEIAEHAKAMFEADGMKVDIKLPLKYNIEKKGKA